MGRPSWNGPLCYARPVSLEIVRDTAGEFTAWLSSRYDERNYTPPPPPLGCPFSLPPGSPPPVPEQTAHVARAAFPKGNPYLQLRDELGTVFGDDDFADLYPRRG